AADATGLAARAVGPGVPGLLELEPRDADLEAVPDAVVGRLIGLEVLGSGAGCRREAHTESESGECAEACTATRFTPVPHGSPRPSVSRAFVHRTTLTHRATRGARRRATRARADR